MAGNRFEFRWKVAGGGYRWIPAAACGRPAKQAEPVLVGAELAEAGEVERGGKEPPAHPQLFRLLALTPPTEEGVLAHANRYGDLGAATEIKPLKRGKTSKTLPRVGTPLSVWRDQIATAARLARLWDLIQDEDTAGLIEHLLWQPTGPHGPAGGGDPRTAGRGKAAPGDVRVGEPIAPSASDLGNENSPGQGDVLLPARLYLMAHLDAQLKQAAQKAPVFMTWDERRERPVVGYECLTQMSAAWLQFATSVNEDLRFGRCPECGTWFEVAPQVARASRKFCSIACRSKAYRERQDRARRMATEMKTIPEIAEELDSDVATVRRWITGYKE